MSDIIEIEDARELDIEKECPVLNNFSEGVYARSVFMPRGSIIVGKKHKTRHLNMVMSGKARVWIDGEIKDIQAPDILESHEGCRKILIILEDMWWTTIHVTEEQDVVEIENEIIDNEDMDMDLKLIVKEMECLG